MSIDFSKGPVWEQVGMDRYDYVRLSVRKRIKIMRKLAGVGWWEGLRRDLRWDCWGKWKWRWEKLDLRPLLNAYNQEREERQAVWKEHPHAFFDDNDRHYR